MNWTEWKWWIRIRKARKFIIIFYGKIAFGRWIGESKENGGELKRNRVKIQFSRAVSESSCRKWELITCIFQVRGLCVGFCPFAAVIPAFACFVCCIIWLIRSNCCLVKPSLPTPGAGELGDGDLELELSPPVVVYCMHVAPCGELASPAICERK